MESKFTTTLIDSALTYICSRLNDHLRVKLEADEEAVVLSNISDKKDPKHSNKITCTLLQMTPERMLHNSRSSIGFSGSTGQESTPLNISLSLIFAANFDADNYQQGLRVISMIVSFFHHNPIFTSEINDIPSELDRLNIEMMDLNAEDLSHVWSALGSSLVPHVAYKLRLIQKP